MAETSTVNYNWTMPDPGASANTWGATLNATTQKVDAQVFANQTLAQQAQQRGVEIGTIAMFGSMTPPANWLLCDGSSLPTTGGTYDKLFAALQYAWGGSGVNFNLPNLVQKFPCGAGAGAAIAATGGEAIHILTAAEMPVHPHPITDVTHNHVVNLTPHTHTYTDPGHQHGGVLRATAQGAGQATGQFLGQTGLTDNFGTNITILPATATVTLNGSGTGLSTTQNAGGDAAHNNLPPFLSVPFIIKFQ